MAIVAGERPGVYTDYTLSGLIGGGRSGYAVGLVCASAKGTPLTVHAVTRESEALEIFAEDTGSARMMRMLRILFAGGVPVVYAVKVAGGAEEEADYAQAFALLREREGIAAMVCDSNSPQVHDALKTSVISASSNRLERIGCVGGGVTSVSECTGEARALNSERMVYTCQPAVVGTDSNACYLAAVIAAAVATSADPSAPLNGMIAAGIESVPNIYEEHEVDTLLRGGVTLFETVGGETELIRVVTTRTQTNGVLDGTYRELNTILIIDNVLSTVRNALKMRLRGAKNNRRNRESIATQTQLELESKLDAGIIDSYERPVVRSDDSDPTVCIVELDFAVTRGLNQIHVSAHVKV